MSEPNADELVLGPATALRAVGLLGIVLSLIGLVFDFTWSGIRWIDQNEATNRPNIYGPGPEEDTAWGGVLACSAISLASGCIVVYGANRMKHLRSHSWARIASIVSIVPFSCCILGLIAGIWSLRVLEKAEVKDAFR
jgi:hypothetical protein